MLMLLRTWQRNDGLSLLRSGLTVQALIAVQLLNDVGKQCVVKEPYAVQPLMSLHPIPTPEYFLQQIIKSMCNALSI